MKLAVKHVTHEHLAILNSAMAELDESRRDYDRWAERNFAFHSAICSITEMPRVREMTSRVFTEWERMRRHFYRSIQPPDLDQAQKEHQAMVDSLKKQDLDRLERLTRAHNQRGAVRRRP
jgi:DNA-binding GntR family transcriptional regulator